MKIKKMRAKISNHSWYSSRPLINISKIGFAIHIWTGPRLYPVKNRILEGLHFGSDKISTWKWFHKSVFLLVWRRFFWSIIDSKMSFSSKSRNVILNWFNYESFRNYRAWNRVLLPENIMEEMLGCFKKCLCY